MHIEIKDKSGESIALFLWGINASKANGLRAGDIIVCSNSTVQYNKMLGKQALYCGVNSKIYINPKANEMMDP